MPRPICFFAELSKGRCNRPCQIILDATSDCMEVNKEASLSERSSSKGIC